LSTSASPKVLEVASKLPCKLRLEEVSWISSWPLQFQGINPDEHNIALFFFAKDVERFCLLHHSLFFNIYLLIICMLFLRMHDLTLRHVVLITVMKGVIASYWKKCLKMI